jgi:hypothetical protein
LAVVVRYKAAHRMVSDLEELIVLMKGKMHLIVYELLHLVEEIQTVPSGFW